MPGNPMADGQRSSGAVLSTMLRLCARRRRIAMKPRSLRRTAIGMKPYRILRPRQTNVRTSMARLEALSPRIFLLRESDNGRNAFVALIFI